MFITCACEHCGQHIEFATDDFQEVRRTPEAVFGQDVTCPACGKETALLISQSPPPGISRKPMSRKTRRRIVIAIIATIIVAIAALLIWKIGAFAIAGTLGLTASVLIYIAVIAGIFLLAIFWLLFPVLMYYQLKRSNELLASLEQNSRAQRAQAEKPSSPA